MGLNLNQDGRLSPEYYSQELQTLSRDNMISRSLIRLMCHLINLQSSTERDPPGGTIQRDYNADVARIERDLNEWFSNLPSSFHPEYHWRRNLQDSSTLDPELFGPEVWFSNPLTATAIVLYNMAQMLLLINRPLTGHHDLLRAYHSLQTKLRVHAAEIFSIALGMPDESVMVRMLQPLYVAGRCLTERPDRRYLVGMIRGIEAKLGLMTEYRVKDLLQEWSSSYEALDLTEKEVVQRQQFWG